MLGVQNYKPFYFRTITPDSKKYSVIVNNGKKLIHFGARKYQHYKDQTDQKEWSELDHNDDKRRKKYRDRHGAIKLKNGELAKDDIDQPAYYSWHYLW